MREHLSTQHLTAIDRAEANARFRTLDHELAELQAGGAEPAWFVRKVASRDPQSLVLEHSSVERDGFIYCETRILSVQPEP